MNNQIQLVLKSSTAEMPLNDQALGIYLTPELDGLVGLPEIRTTSGVNAGYDGGWTSAQNYDARSITIRGVIANENVATVERLRKQLVSLAGQGKSEELTLDLVTEAGNAYTLQVRTIALEMSMQSVLTQQQFMLQLRADDPLIYDAGESEHEATLQVAKATGGFTIDFELPLAITGGSEESVVNNDGLEEVPTIVKMYGALHNPKIINQTNNEQMQIMADLGYAEGAWHTPSETSEGAIISLANTPDSAPFSDVQLKGDTAQNGTPTPSAPVAVQTVTGENVVKITGKNLLDSSSYEDAYISNTGVKTTGGGLNALFGYISVSPSTSYTISASSSTRFSAAFYNGETYISRDANHDGTSYTFTTPNNCNRIRCWVWRQSGVDQSYINSLNLQIELGSTATAYEPYQWQSYEVNLNAPNLYDTTSTYSSGGSSQNISLQLSIEPSQTYTFDANKTWTTVYLYDGSDTQTRTIGGESSVKKITFTAASNEVKAELIFYSGQQYVNVQTYDYTGIKFYNNEDVIELCKIGDYQDYIYKSGGKWYKHKEVVKILYDGTEDWRRQPMQYTDGYYDYGGKAELLTAPSGTSRLNPLATQYFQPASPDDNWFTAVGSSNVAHLNDSKRLRFTKGETKNSGDVTAWKAWVQSVGLTVYGPAATQSEIEITNEALIAQLDDLLNLSRTYQGQTNMADLAASGNMPAILNVSYFTEQDPDTRDELIIDSRLHTVTLNGLDIYHLIGEGSEFLMLEPGENRLSLQSDITGDNGYAVVSYKQGYLSI